MGPIIAKCRSDPQGGGETSQIEQPVQATHQRKRFNPFFIPNSQTTSQTRLHERFKFVSNYQDRFMDRKRATVVTEVDRVQNECRLQRICPEFEEQKTQSKLTIKSIKNSKDVIMKVQIFGKKVDGMLNNYSKATVILQYPLLSLKRQFNNRLLNKIDFTTMEIVDVIFSTIQAYAFLEKSGQINNKIRLAHIFIGVDRSKSSKPKAIDGDLLLIPDNYQCMIDKGYQSAENHDIYLSPEQFKAYLDKQQNPPEEQRNKAGVFSLGASILDICIMNSTYQTYNYHNKTFKQGDIKGLINIARKRHGLLIYKLLTQMLQFQVHKRPTFQELQILISKPLSQSQGGSALRLSTVRDGNSKYMDITRHSAGAYGKVSQTSHMSISIADRQFCRAGEFALQQQEELINMHEKYTNGNQYIGQKKLDLKHGRGKYIFKDRSYYQGQWKDDMMHGEGQLFFNNGKVQYQGEWAEDQPNGWGLLYAPSQFDQPQTWTHYQGQMKNGQMNGRGKLWFIDGTIFEGQFQNGKIFGRGCRIESNGKMVQKEWQLKSVSSFLDYQQKALSININPSKRMIVYHQRE